MTKHFIDISEFDESDLRNIFDFAKEDGKQTLIDLEETLSEKFPVKLKVGKHYGALS